MAITKYMVADNFNVAEGSLAAVSPQPTSQGIRPGRRTWGADGTPLDESKYCELNFSMVEDVTAYQALLTAFGVNSALTNEVTVGIRDETFAFVRKNAVAIRPEIGRDVSWERFFPRDITILLRDIATAS